MWLRKGFCLGLWFQRERSKGRGRHDSRHRNRKLKDHILMKQREWSRSEQGYKFSSPSPLIYPIQQGSPSQSFHNIPEQYSAGNQVFKYSAYSDIVTQTTKDPIIYLSNILGVFYLCVVWRISLDEKLVDMGSYPIWPLINKDCKGKSVSWFLNLENKIFKDNPYRGLVFSICFSNQVRKGF